MASTDRDVLPPKQMTELVVVLQGAAPTDRQAFLTGLSHDLRQMLTVIGGTAQLAERRLAASGTAGTGVSDALTIIRDAAKRMTQQLTELEDFAMVDAERSPALDRCPVDLVAMARAAAARHAPISDCHRFSVVVDGGEDVPLVGKWDARRLERVLDNLVDNARKFSPTGGNITITVGREAARAVDGNAGEVAVLQVADEGIGIPKEDLPHVFDWFHRAEHSAAAIPGTGVGLAVVREIIERHGGTVEATSALGGGSTFAVRLPLS